MVDNLCYICLNRDGQTYIYQKHLQEHYNYLVAAKLNFNGDAKFCKNCASILFYNFLFKRKCYLAQKALKEFELKLQKNEDNTTLLNDLREKYKLKPNLSYESMLEIVTIEPGNNCNETISKTTDPLTELQCINRRIFFYEHKDDNNLCNIDTDSDIKLIKIEPWTEIEDCRSSLSDCEIKQTKDNHSKLKKNAIGNKPKTIELKPRKNVLDTDEKILEYYLDGTKWQITKLSDQEMLLQFKKTSELPTYTKSPHKCTLCFRGFLYSEKLLRHVKTAHNEENTLACKICKYRTASQAKMKFHKLKHKYTYKCRDCGFFTTNLSSVKFHQETHESVNKTCNICGEVFVHSSTFYTHVREMHNSEHLCLMCGKSFVSALGVAFHMKRTHFIDYSRRGRKRKLKQGAKEEDNKHRCDTCDVTFYNENAYKMHFVHSSKHNNQLMRFRNTAIVRRFRKGSRKGALEAAENNKEIEPGVLCEICGKSVKVTTLPMHRNSHTRQKLYSCSICQMEFVQKSSLNRHMVRHTGDKAFKCDLCDKSYTQGGSLKLHVRTAHLNMPYPKRNRWKRKQTEPVLEN